MRLIYSLIVFALILPGLTSAAGQTIGSGPGLPSSFFPIVTWDPQHGWNNQFEGRLNGLESISDCGFAVAGMVQTRDIEVLEELGLKGFAFGDHETVTMRQWNPLFPGTPPTDDRISHRYLLSHEHDRTQ